MSKYFDGEKLNGFDESPETTIFGEKHFIDKLMISIIEERGKAIDNFVYDEIEEIARYEFPMPKIIINKEKVKKWLIMCSKLENIEHSELVDMAVKKKISDLEAKLAESEESLNEVCIKMEDEVSKWVRYSSNIDRENNELKQQLAEKEKEISEALAKQSITCLNTIEKAYQDKISFAVEQLEKVKELIHSHEKIYLSLNDFKIINEIFNNQIKQLKEGK